ncbi:MAG: hypothetical protein WEF50_09745 [Myxococcota bacterium]
MLNRGTTIVGFIALVFYGCAWFGRYIYQVETRVEPVAVGVKLSEADLQRAEGIAAFVADKCRLRSGDASIETAGIEDRVSALKEPPRELLVLYARKVYTPGRLPIELSLEVSEDRRTLYFTSVDYERGEPSNFLDCMREGVKAMTEREFKGMSITHEVRVIGPVYTHP